MKKRTVLLLVLGAHALGICQSRAQFTVSNLNGDQSAGSFGGALASATPGRANVSDTYTFTSLFDTPQTITISANLPSVIKSAARTLTIAPPGNSPGTMTTGAGTWNGGGGYVWEINNATGAKGADPGWDWLNTGGALTLNNTSGSKFTIYVTSLTAGSDAGLAPNFVRGITYSFPIATATAPISGFSANKFTIDTSAFQNDPTNQGGWALVLSGDGLTLNLTYTAIPEPSEWGTILGAALGGLALLRRRLLRR